VGEQTQQTVSPEVLKALRGIDPTKSFSPELFGELARLVPSVAVEAVALRERKGKVEVFLTRRSANDAAYPNMLHSPGSILRAGETYQDVMKRLVFREFKVSISYFKLVDEIFYGEERGWFNSRIFLVELDGKPAHGQWTSVDELPSDVVDHHLNQVIPLAAKHFRARRL
jgi:ADP-ribose pyrophosphatase YjhB (NUDIX family)